VKQYLTVLAVNVGLLASLAACAAPPDQDADAGGPTFIQSPASTIGLVGATPQMLAAAFGQPALLRVDGPAQVWLYHAGGCGLNLILYPDTGGTPRVATAAPTDDADLAACSTALARAHAAAGTPITAAVTPAAALTSRPAAPPPAAPASALEPAVGDDGLERPASS
jgi:hypothetical protein